MWNRGLTKYSPYLLWVEVIVLMKIEVSLVRWSMNTTLYYFFKDSQHSFLCPFPLLFQSMKFRSNIKMSMLEVRNNLILLLAIDLLINQMDVLFNGTKSLLLYFLTVFLKIRNGFFILTSQKLNLFLKRISIY